LFLCFFGKYRGDAHHPHESPPSMWIPLAILAALSLGGGYINIPQFLTPMFGEPHEGEPWLMYVSVAMGLGGILIAYLFYVVSPAVPDALARGFSGPYRWIYNKFYVDEFYDATVVSPIIDGSRELLWRVADVRIIDGMVNGAGTTASGVGNLLRRAQSGYIRSYAGWVVGGAILVIAYMGLKGGL
jgi:NADH-quinone oxidoreductase subunit L